MKRILIVLNVQTRNNKSSKQLSFTTLDPWGLFLCRYGTAVLISLARSGVIVVIKQFKPCASQGKKKRVKTKLFCTRETNWATGMLTSGNYHYTQSIAEAECH